VPVPTVVKDLPAESPKTIVQPVAREVAREKDTPEGLYAPFVARGLCWVAGRIAHQAEDADGRQFPRR